MQCLLLHSFLGQGIRIPLLHYRHHYKATPPHFPLGQMGWGGEEHSQPNSASVKPGKPISAAWYGPSKLVRVRKRLNKQPKTLMLLSGLKSSYTWMNVSSYSDVNTSLPSSPRWVWVGDLLIVNHRQVTEYPVTAERSQPNPGCFASAKEERDSHLLAPPRQSSRQPRHLLHLTLLSRSEIRHG